MKAGTWDQMPVSVSQHPTLSPAAVGLYAKIASFIRPGDSEELLTKNLAAWLGVSKDTVRRLVAELTEAEVLVVKRTRKSAGHQGPNRYSLGPVALAGEAVRQTPESAGLATDPESQISSPRVADLVVQSRKSGRGKALRARPKSQTQEPDKDHPPTPQPEAAGTTEGGGGLSERGSSSRQAAGSSVVNRGRDTDAGAGRSTEEFAASSGRGQQEQPTTEGESMSEREPVWVRVGLPSLAELETYFEEAEPRTVVGTSVAGLMQWRIEQPGGLERERATVEAWKQRNPRERAYRAALVEHADYVAEFEAWTDARLGIGLVGSRRHRLVSPEQERGEPPSRHRALLAYVAARRRRLTADDLLTRMLALPVGAEDAPEAWDWLDEQQAVTVSHVDDYGDGDDFAYAGGDPMAAAF